MTSFQPGDDSRAFRTALGAYTTGVTIVTAMGPRGPLGMTANSFASVSLDPPMVLWSPARKSLRFPVFSQASHFAVHILGAEQRDLCALFAGKGHDFEGLPMRENPEGVPIIDGCLTVMECETVARHDGGDHMIVVAQVLRANTRDGAPLVFSRGHYGEFEPHH